MVDMDWRQILSFSQRELKDEEKEKLCESLSWMEADDIELNFSDLKTLFRLAQDILKFKSEKVNNLMGKLEVVQRKYMKKKNKSIEEESPSKHSDSYFDTIAHQEDAIKANKEVLDQLYVDIAELERRKKSLEKDQSDNESSSSRDPLSELNAIDQLENEIVMKNRHIRKLLTDVKMLEEENLQLKEKTSELKDKLTEATILIGSHTGQLVSLNKDCETLKELLANAEETKVKLETEIEMLQKELNDKDSENNRTYSEIKNKILHWKNIAKSRKVENNLLTDEIKKLREICNKQVNENDDVEKEDTMETALTSELQTKLMDATKEILTSARIIDKLKSENQQLKNRLEKEKDNLDIALDTKNICDDNKQGVIITELKKEVSKTKQALRSAENMLELRENELTDLTNQLQIFKSGKEGFNELLENLKSKRQQLKLKDEIIKSLVKESNTLSQVIDALQIENEAMRDKLKIPLDSKIETTGIVKKYSDMEKQFRLLQKTLRDKENILINVEVQYRNERDKVKILDHYLRQTGLDDAFIAKLLNEGISDDSENHKNNNRDKKSKYQTELDAMINENEGLRKGLQEILDYLKNNSTSSSGVLALECPSLETIVNSLEARHAAGWFAPHMATVLELKAAIGGRDALLKVLHENRQETFRIMTQLSDECKKSQALELKLKEMENKNIPVIAGSTDDDDLLYFDNLGVGNIQTEIDSNIDFQNVADIEKFIDRNNSSYENQITQNLSYFSSKFRSLYDNMTTLAIRTADEQNKWFMQEEEYKAEIQNLKILLSQKEDDDLNSDDSPGLIGKIDNGVLQRRCDYLEESFKMLRTMNENLKNESLEMKKELLVNTGSFEVKIQNLMIALFATMDKLRRSISIDLFWKQNREFNEMTIKHRQLVEDKIKNSILNYKNTNSNHTNNDTNNSMEKNNATIEQTMLEAQLKCVCNELEQCQKRLEDEENKNTILQESQSKLIDTAFSSLSEEEVNMLKEKCSKLETDNCMLKEQCRLNTDKLDIALMQLQDLQQKQFNNVMEINMLNHQILDLQSTSDSKAIIARLSGEILILHLQATESYKKIDRLNATLLKEVQKKIEAEEMLETREKVFSVYSKQFESKFKYMYEVMQTLRQQYQGGLPLISIENYLNELEELSRNTRTVNYKLDEIENLQSNLISKQTLLDHLLSTSKSGCLNSEDNCPHKVQLLISQGMSKHEKAHNENKIRSLEQSHDGLLSNYLKLEKTMVLLCESFGANGMTDTKTKKDDENDNYLPVLKLEDVQSDDDSSIKSNHTITLPKPLILKLPKNATDMSKILKNEVDCCLPGSPLKEQLEINKSVETASVFVQTTVKNIATKNKYTQTDVHKDIQNMGSKVKELETNYQEITKKLSDATAVANRTAEDKLKVEKLLAMAQKNLEDKDNLLRNQENELFYLKNELSDLKTCYEQETLKQKEANDENIQSLLVSLKNLENEKNAVTNEYKQMLENERHEFLKTVQDLNLKVVELTSQLERKHSDSTVAQANSDTDNTYTLQIVNLEEKCFKLQSEIENCRTETSTYRKEAERWKELASDRLTKMDQLYSQLGERHNIELKSYKTENEQWISRLSDVQNEHMELKAKMAEQKVIHSSQIAEKESQADHLRSVIQNLKIQLMNLQTMMSVHDPSFDLSAIVEVEDSDQVSPRGTGALEIRFDSATDLHDVVPIPATSSAIWQDSVVDKLRREKQLMGKQNNLLRRQIKALTGREKRARLEAQNLKNQIYRISTSGSKAAAAETVVMQSKIASLQTQLISARRETNSTINMWDKLKRAQQSSERWQAKYEEKCIEVRKLESSMNSARNAIARLEREKRVLLSKVSEVHNERSSTEEKQDNEKSEKDVYEDHYPVLNTSRVPSHVSSDALMDRIEAQQRRIAALEIAERGNEPLVSEYEKALAENTSLRGQVLKLESALLEAQIRSSNTTNNVSQPELEYWKNYCEMLKAENAHLTLQLSAAAAPASAHQQRVHDLEQTVLTLRGLVSKLQAEHKYTGSTKRLDVKPPTDRSPDQKSRSQLDSYRTEIANLKKTLADKDNLLEKSKKMLRLASEREDELLHENAYLRRQLVELVKPRSGFLSA